MESGIAYLIRLVSAGFVLLTGFSMRAGEVFKAAWVARAAQPRTNPQKPHVSNARGVPAAKPVNTGLANTESADVTRRGVFKVIDVKQRLSAALETQPTAEVQPDSLAAGLEPAPEDDLDWAGSLSHATVANLHLAQLLALVREGWLVPLEAKQSQVGDCLDLIAAFEERTACAVAPVIMAMTDAQRAEFFEGFEDFLPLELLELEAANA